MPQHAVQPAQLHASRVADDMLVAENVTEGIGVAVVDPVRGVAGLLHIREPDSRCDRAAAGREPARFADTGVEQLVRRVIQLGGRPGKVTVKIAGCRQGAGKVSDDLARRNYAAVRKALWRAGLLVDAEDVGGETERTLVVSVGDGAVLLKTGDDGRTL